jgi:hypothetical protein
MTTRVGAGEEQQVRLRDVELGDISAYVRMRCDPVVMAELGGPLPREGIESLGFRFAGEREVTFAITLALYGEVGSGLAWLPGLPR